ncbi:MAG: cupin domain-containing protein [Chthoniobacterales bacterium]
MIIRNLENQKSFTTADSSTIRSILDLSNAPVKNQSLAEASLPAGAKTIRHYHKLSEEFYFFLSGRALMEIDGEEKEVKKGDCVLIPPGSWHQVTAYEEARFLCCCAPPYAHSDTYFADEQTQ